MKWMNLTLWLRLERRVVGAAAYAALGLASDGGMSWRLPRSLADQLILKAGAMGDLAGADRVLARILALE